MTQNRFKSWALWLSISAFIAFIAKAYFGYEIPQFDTLVNMILGILTLLGILNNPTNKTSA